MSGYFWNGFQHFVVGLVFVALFRRLAGNRAGQTLGFWVGLVFGSSALFFIPAHVGAFGSLADKAYQFLHYPLPDWDVLILGMPWHRFFLTHSLILFIPAFGLDRGRKFRSLLLGLCLGVSSHLVWDAVTSAMQTPIVFWAGALVVHGVWAKSWLLVNGAGLFWFAVVAERRGKCCFYRFLCWPCK